MEKILTAEEFMSSKGWAKPKHIMIGGEDVEKIMIEFAKMHVKAQAEAICEKAYVEFVNFQDNEIFDYSDVLNDDDIGANVNKDSILNAYPESNIV